MVGERACLRVRYCAGALLLDGRDPRQVLYHSARSLLAPRVAAERVGAVADVVFPTGLDARPDGQPDVYYGMADSRIGVARGETEAAHALAQATLRRVVVPCLRAVALSTELLQHRAVSHALRDLG